LKSAGFQLSFLAVCGIVFLHPQIVTLPGISNRFLFRIWELISISIAAQLATFPVSVYYFHQFPNYFLPANMIIIPLSTLIMYSGLILLSFDWIPGAGWLFGTITCYGINVLNNIVKFFGELPYAISENIFIDEMELFLLYALIVFSTLWLVLKYHGLFFTTLTCIILILSYGIHFQFRSGNEYIFTVYHDKLHPVISVVRGNEAVLFRDDNNAEIPDCFTNDISGKPIKKVNHYTITSNNAIQLSKGMKTVLICQGWNNNRKLENSFDKTPDYLVLSGNSTVTAEEILKQLNPGLVILDSTFKNRTKTKLKAELNKAGIPCYDIAEQGAFLSRDF
jgi:competence protein ComEC